MLRWK